jgi:GH18 family chitinase
MPLSTGKPLHADTDQIGSKYFNGVTMIKRKTKYAADLKLGGVMIWEVGQDNFINELKALDPATSLMLAITDAIADAAVGQPVAAAATDIIKEEDAASSNREEL